MKDRNKKENHLLGVGLDNKDGHKRMTETVVKTFEDIKSKGKELEDVDPGELADLLKKNVP